MLPRLPRSTLFPYTTLFRSVDDVQRDVSLEELESQRTVLVHVPLADLQEAPVGTQDGETRRDGFLEIGKRSEEHTSELQSHSDLVCRLLLEKKKKKKETV